MSRRRLLLLECVGLFYVLPLVLYFLRQHATFVVFPLLLVTAAVCLLYLLDDETFDRSLLGGWGRAREFLVPILALLVGGGLLLALYTRLELPELFLAFPRAEPLTWLIVLLLYPILVVPQELIFRCFFFQRYRLLLPNRWGLIFCNGVSFGLYHVFYTHWQAVVLTLVGGWLFAYRYNSSRSLVIVCIEHALWGNLLFTIGLGWFLYTGSIQ
jgi:membrane protease YdiL (CAAX protease family)